MGHFNLIFVGEDYEGKLKKYNFLTRDSKYLKMKPYYDTFYFQHTCKKFLKRDESQFKNDSFVTLFAKKIRKHGIENIYVVEYSESLFIFEDPLPTKKLWVYRKGKNEPEFFCEVISLDSNKKTVIVKKIEFPKNGKLYKNREEFKKAFFIYDRTLCEWVTPFTPDGRFDWYELGGRWTGFFKIKENPRFPKKIKTGTCLDEDKIKPGYADQICVCDVDWEFMRRERNGKITERRKRYASFLLEYKERKKPDQIKYLFYINNVRNMAKRKNKFIPESEKENIERLDILPVYAICKDGEWEDVDSWFAKQEDKMDQNNSEHFWGKRLEIILHNLPDDTVLTMIDCHE